MIVWLLAATRTTPAKSSTLMAQATSPSASAAITFATYNVQSGRAGRLISVLRAMQQMNLDLVLLTETKLTDRVYTRQSLGYQVVATEASSAHKGCVALCWWSR